MTTFALAATDLGDRRIPAPEATLEIEPEAGPEIGLEPGTPLPRSVANPRRTTWTGLPWDDHDRLRAG